MAGLDAFDRDRDTASNPARRAVTVTPHDSNEVTPVPKALYVGTAGNITLRAVDSGADVVFKNLPAGYLLLVRALIVRATGTTAADIVALC